MLSALGWLFCGCTTAGTDLPQEAAPPLRNLLIVTFDTTRRDFVGFMGKRPSPTPNLDQLAARSVVFEDGWTVAPITLPAHSSLMTGLYPISHGVHENTSFRLPESARTLAEILHDHGYGTAAAVAAFVLDPMFGIDQGFTRYSTPSTQAGTMEAFLSERRAAQQVDVALADLAELARQPPFFYWLHFFDPHFPYAAPDSRAPTLEEAMRPNGAVRHLYEEELHYADAQLGRLVAALQQKGLFEDLVVVFAADHGESLGDAPEGSHGFFLFDPTVRIPLLIKHPELPPRRVATPASLIDVVPTLLDLLGIGEPGLAFDGVDLAPLLRAPGSEPPDRALGLESWFAYLNYGWAPFDGCTQGTFKYLRSRREELFDRATDPGEKVNLFAPDDPRSTGMARRLEQILGHPANKLVKDPLSLSGADRQRLERLGYAVAEGATVEEHPDASRLADPYEKVAVIKQLEEVVRARSENRVDLAVEVLRKLVLEEEGSASLHEELGTLLLDLGNDHLDEAEVHLKAALHIDPRRSRSHYAAALCATRRIELARAQARQHRETGDLEGAKPFVQEERKQARRATKAFRACLEFEPNFPDAIASFGRFLMEDAERAARAGEKAEALAAYDEIDGLLEHWLAIQPQTAPGWLEMQEQRARCRTRRQAIDQDR